MTAADMATLRELWFKLDRSRQVLIKLTEVYGNNMRLKWAVTELSDACNDLHTAMERLAEDVRRKDGDA